MRAGLLFTEWTGLKWKAAYGLRTIYAGGQGATKTRAIMAAIDRWKWLLAEMANDPNWGDKPIKINSTPPTP